MVKAGFERSNVYRTIRKIEIGQVNRKPRSGKKVVGLTNQKERKMCEAADLKVGISFRKLGRKFKMHHNTVKKILKKNGINMYK